MKRVWCLYRVSTKGQVDKDDIPMQRIACHGFVGAKTDWVIENELYEKGVSGYKVSTNSRDAITEIKAAALAKKFDVLLVFMFDRIGRREDETPFVVQWLVEQGVEVWSTREGEQRFDSHVDKLLNYIRYWQAAGESEKTAYRIKTRHQQMALSGVYRGGYVPYGYYTDFCGRVNKKGTPVRDLLIDDAEAAVIQVIFHLIVDLGYGGNRVANYLNEQGIKTKEGTNLWRATGIRAIVRNPIYVGRMRLNNELSEATESYRIVSDFVFEKANELIAGRAAANTEERHGARKSSDGLLTGLIYCGECGERMVYNKCHKNLERAEGQIRYEWSVYRCYRKVNNRRSCEGPSTYVVHRIEDVVMDAVRQFFSRLLQQPDEALLASVKNQDSSVTDNAMQRAEVELEAASKAMKALEAEAMKALTGEGGLDITMVNQMLPKCRERLETAQREYERVCKAAEEAKAAKADRTEEIAVMRSWADTFDTASLDAKRMVVAALVKRIEVRRDYDITIKFRLTEMQFFGDMITEKGA